MKKFNLFMDKYKYLIWVILMVLLCILDAMVLALEFNVWSLIGLVCCAISAILYSISFVRNLKNRDEDA